jgi:chromatin remodeling complex protein RSC6
MSSSASSSTTKSAKSTKVSLKNSAEVSVKPVAGKKKAAPKTETVVVVEQPPAPSVVSVVSVAEELPPQDVTMVVATEGGETDEQELVRKLRELSAKHTALSQLAAEIRSDQKYVEKLSLKVEKNSKKKMSKKNKVKSTTRAPSGFIKPTLISDELATFLNKPFGSEMARTEVTKEINVYICANDLKDKVNGRIIKADDKLATLLKVGKDDELTYFNLQKYMSPHFAKGKQAVATTTA